MRIRWITGTFLLVGTITGYLSPAHAQSSNGYVGVYSDSSGTVPCATISPSTGTTLYVIAKTAGISSAGLTGAEFRIEVTSPSGWYFNYSAPDGANIVLGNPIDTDPDPEAGGGMNINFPSCQTPSGGKVRLGTISVYNGSGGPTNLLVKRHSTPTNGGYQCPAFVGCGPVLTMLCMTPSTEAACSLATKPCAVQDNDPVIFTAALNTSTVGIDVPAQMPENQVIVMFRSGVIQLPEGYFAATLQNASIGSEEVSDALEVHDVEAVAKAFPEFNPADSLGTSRTGQVVRLSDFSEIYRLVLAGTGDPEALVEALSSNRADVIYAHIDDTPNFFGSCVYDATHGGAGSACPESLATCPDDVLFMEQWALNNQGQTVTGESGTSQCGHDIDAIAAWEITIGSPNSRIGILDTGVTYFNVPDLAGKVIFGNLDISGSHGTEVAALAAARGNDGTAIAGVDWNAQIVSYDISSSTTSQIGTAINAAVGTHHATILNCSWGISSSAIPAVNLALRDAYMQNVSIVAAMGDGGGSTPEYPAAFKQGREGIIAVGGTDPFDDPLDGSNYGSHVDVAAPGVNLYTDTLDEESPLATLVTGNSYSTALVSGTVSLLQSYSLAISPGDPIANDDIANIIKLTAASTEWNQYTGYGRIRAGAALEALLPPNRLLHLESTNLAGIRKMTTDSDLLMLRDLPPGIQTSEIYGVDIWQVYGSITFPETFTEIPKVWARGAETLGYGFADSTFGQSGNIWFGYGWCQPYAITTQGCSLRTYVYEGFDLQGNSIGWMPTDRYGVKYAISVWGETTNPTDAQMIGDQTSRLTLSCMNPAREETKLQMYVTSQGSASLEIFDVAGRRLRALHTGVLEAGRHNYRWDGRTDAGERVASGIYFARARAAGQTVTRRLVLLR